MPSINNRFDYSTRKNNVVKVSPTLLIGLGGSGKEVLMRLRRLFYTNMRKTGLPIMEYLWIDTDPRRQDIRGLDYDAISNSLYLEETDIIDAQINPSELDNYNANPAAYSHIFEWLHPSLHQLGPNKLQGPAVKDRPLGRLAFFVHFTKIREVINRKLSLIMDPNRIEKTTRMGYTVNPAITNVFLVTSIAGGTGAGMFLDMSFLLKELPSQGGYNINTTGILFLPSVFEKVLNGKSVDVARSNGYASLMELDYYMSPKVGVNVDNGSPHQQFEFKWDGDIHEVDIAPLDTIYLLGGINNAGTRLGSDYTDIFQMAADSIFLEYSDSLFGDEKRRIRVKMEHFLLDETKYDELNTNEDIIFSQYSPNRYSSFGLSFIKLDIDRKRNAAAYYLGQELASHWKSGSSNNTKAIASVNSAFNFDGLQSRLNKKSLTGFILRKPSGTPMTDKHEQSISDGFGAISLWIDHLFDRNNLAGYETCCEEIKRFVNKYNKEPDVRNWPPESIKCYDEEIGRFSQPIEEQIEDIFVSIYRIVYTWNYVDGKIRKELLITGNDHRQIVKNVGILSEMIIKNFESEYFKLIKTPGDTPSSNGIVQAELFCKEYIQEIKNIISSLARENAPEFSFKPDIVQNKNLNKIKKYKIEAQSFSEPGLFGNSARIITERRYTDSLKTYCRVTKDEIGSHITSLKKDLLDRTHIQYKNCVFTYAKEMFEKVVNHVDTFLKRTTTYNNRLDSISVYQNNLFNAYNKNQKDIRYHHIKQPPDGTFYKSEIKRTLNPGRATMNWIDYLDKETDNFFDKLYRKIIDPTIPENFNTREWGFKYIFETLVNYPPEDSRYKDFQNCMDEYCFKRLENFMDNTNADIEFQISSVDHSNVINNICEKAGVWIQPTNLGIHPQNIVEIGVPSIQNSTMVDEVIATIPDFNTVNKIAHEKDNFIFYKEQAAFPLLHLKEVEECFHSYTKMSENYSDIYKRHINYKEIIKLRQILPPPTQEKAAELFSTGIVAISALIFGCLKFLQDDPNDLGYFFFESPRHLEVDIIPLGRNLTSTIQILNDNQMYVNILNDNLNLVRLSMQQYWPDYRLKQLKMIDYYCMKVFPRLVHDVYGNGMMINYYDSNIGLICNKIRKDYIAKCKNGEAYIDDDTLFKTIDEIDIEDISEIIAYKDIEANDVLRALKGVNA